LLQIQIKKKENDHWLEFENWPLKIYIYPNYQAYRYRSKC